MAENKYGNFESIVDYTTVLDNFEGPLDYLLHLINIAQIRIEDIFVSKVTEQFLAYIEYMKTQPSRDMDKESEYLTIAAQIIYIKSKSLVPIEIEDDYSDVEDAQQDLIDQLRRREYELLQGETPKLKDLETVGYCFKEPDENLNTVKVVYKDFTVSGLLEAFAKMMLRNESLQREKVNVKEIPKDPYTVEQKFSYIRERLVECNTIMFESLFTVYSASEIITTFQAILEMLKHQCIFVEQEQDFGDFLITLNPDWDLKDLSDEELN